MLAYAGKKLGASFFPKPQSRRFAPVQHLGNYKKLTPVNVSGQYISTAKTLTGVERQQF